MKYFKLILFIITASAFLFSIYALYNERNSHSVGNSIGAYFTFFAILIALVTGVITLIVLFRSPINYLYIFGGLASIPLLLILIGQINIQLDRLRIDKYHAWSHQLEIQEIEIWRHIENTDKVEELLSKTKPFTNDNYKEYKIFKASIYLGLSSHDVQYFSKYLQFSNENKLDKCDIIQHILKNKKLETEEDYLDIFKALNEPNKGLNYCIPTHQDAIKKEDFHFKTLYTKGFKKAALLALYLKTEDPKYYIDQLKRIKDLEFQQEGISNIIKSADFSNFDNKAFYTLILEQKNEKDFEIYLKLFTQQLKTLPFKETEFINQEEHVIFMKLYNQIGRNHSFINTLPKKYVQSQVAYQKDIEGKPFIQFTQFYAQVVNLEHSHSYDGYYFYIKHGDKLIYKGLTNKYGCISYKSYGLKPTDIIEISVDNLNYKTQIGWQQLLPPWNTADGTNARFYAIGYNPEHEKAFETFTLDIAKKIKIDFDNYFDKKWTE